jgi:hypothetical protein
MMPTPHPLLLVPSRRGWFIISLYSPLASDGGRARARGRKYFFLPRVGKIYPKEYRIRRRAEAAGRSAGVGVFYPLEACVVDVVQLIESNHTTNKDYILGNN